MTATARADLAGLLDRMGKGAAARPMFESAVADLRLALGPHHVILANTLFSYGILLIGDQDYAGADRTLSEALAIYGPARTETGHCQRYLGISAMGQERYAEAADHFRRAADLFRRIDGDDDVERWRSLANLGWAEERSGRIGEGRAQLAEAVAQIERLLGRERYELRLPLEMYGEALTAAGEANQAVAVLQRLQALELKLFGTREHREVAESELVLARALLARQAPGDRQLARQVLDETLGIFARVHPLDRQRGEALLESGRLALAEHDAARARLDLAGAGGGAHRHEESGACRHARGAPPAGGCRGSARRRGEGTPQGIGRLRRLVPPATSRFPPTPGARGRRVLRSPGTAPGRSPAGGSAGPARRRCARRRRRRRATARRSGRRGARGGSGRPGARPGSARSPRWARPSGIGRGGSMREVEARIGIRIAADRRRAEDCAAGPRAELVGEEIHRGAKGALHPIGRRAVEVGQRREVAALGARQGIGHLLIASRHQLPLLGVLGGEEQSQGGRGLGDDLEAARGGAGAQPLAGGKGIEAGAAPQLLGGQPDGIWWIGVGLPEETALEVPGDGNGRIVGPVGARHQDRAVVQVAPEVGFEDAVAAGVGGDTGAVGRGVDRPAVGVAGRGVAPFGDVRRLELLALGGGGSTVPAASARCHR